MVPWNTHVVDGSTTFLWLTKPPYLWGRRFGARFVWEYSSTKLIATNDAYEPVIDMDSMTEDLRRLIRDYMPLTVALQRYHIKTFMDKI
ncbi:hypothetical protein KIN20_000040 [Parelaphostrongylus tenuis]|uniref:Uncharacterized protein n=1 Tax=Parelaphostrongylus tenuis TaxID=148309 RepID=A0AAD5QB68_PARTN|nr:hypothetical protein KIN20_000040 [Parelaphostrongylus tenuis]